MPEDKQLAIPITGNEEWAEIVDMITESLSGDDLPNDVIKAAELMLAGYPVIQVAKKLGVKKEAVRYWLTKYPALSATVANSRKLLQRWRMAQLEQLFMQAVERSREVLDVELNGETPDGVSVDPKVLTVVAAQARYFIGLFAAQQQSLTVVHELGDTVMKAQDNALDYLATKLKEQAGNSDQEPIEAVYRIIDPRMDAAGPMLNSDGTPPFGKLGEVDRNDDGTLCCICGKRFKNMHTHLSLAHGTTATAYEALFMLDHGVISGVNEFATKSGIE